MYDTGIMACDLLKEVHFTGNITPQIWYKVFVKKELKIPKPHLLAINILADIVYWYRPTEVRDEGTGQLIGYKKKFKSDLLQRSYSQIADLFGCSNGQAKEAVVFLENMGVIKRVFRDMKINGVICNNILFISLDVELLKKLTYTDDENSFTGVWRNIDGGGLELQQSGTEKDAEGGLKSKQTNTEGSSSNISPESIFVVDDGIRAIETAGKVIDEYIADRHLSLDAYFGMTPETKKNISAMTDAMFHRFSLRKPNEQDVFRVFQYSYSSRQAEDGTSWVITFPQSRRDLLMYAFEGATLAGAHGNWNYIEGILQKLNQRGIKTLSEAEKYDEERAHHKMDM